MTGNTMSLILRKIMEMRLNKEIADKSAKILIKEILQTACFEDGNVREATEEIDRMFCGHCDKRVPVSEPIYDAEEIFFRFRHTINSEHFDNYALYSNFFCEDCFRGFLSTNLEKIDVDYKTVRRKICHFFRGYGIMKNKGLLYPAISISYFVTAP